MADVLAPCVRPKIPHQRVRTSRVVSAEEWGSAATLAAWIQSRGGSAIPTRHVGLEIPTGSPIKITDTSLTEAACGWWRGPTVAFAIVIAGHIEEGTSHVDLTVGDGTTTFGSWRQTMFDTVPAFVRSSRVYHFALPARGGEIRIVVEAVATAPGAHIDLVQVMELPRSSLFLDSVDYAVLPGSCGAHSPIRDLPHFSVRGAVDAYLYADARRQTCFDALDRDHPILFTGATAKTDLWPLGIPMQAQIRSPGDTDDESGIVCAIDYRFDEDGDKANKSLLYVDTAASGFADSKGVSDTAGAWKTAVFRPKVATEDLDSIDGRRGGAWEMLRISANVLAASGTPTLEIGRVHVCSASAQGESGWSGSNYLQQPATATLAGSGTGVLTRVAMFRLDAITGATQVLFEHLDAGPSGWVLYVNPTGQMLWSVRDGALTFNRTLGPMTEGRVYVATGAWDGDELTLTLNDVSATPQVGTGFLEAAAGFASIGGGGTNVASGVTLLGLASSDSSVLTGSEAVAYNERCLAVGDMRPFAGCEHLYTARVGLHCDLIGDAHWAINGSTALERFVPRVG